MKTSYLSNSERNKQSLNFIWHGIKIADLYKMLVFKKEQIKDIKNNSDFLYYSDFFNWMFVDDQLENFHKKYKSCDLSQESNIRLLLAYKYLYALESMFEGIIGEDIFSMDLSFYLEWCVQDYKCSIFLLDKKYNRQSLQVLRSSLETAIYHLFYSLKGEDYFSLREMKNFRSPSMNGKEGILSELKASDLITLASFEQLSATYKSLSAYTHSYPTVSFDNLEDDQCADIVCKVGRIHLNLFLDYLRVVLLQCENFNIIL